MITRNYHAVMSSVSLKTIPIQKVKEEIDINEFVTIIRVAYIFFNVKVIIIMVF